MFNIFLPAKMLVSLAKIDKDDASYNNETLAAILRKPYDIFIYGDKTQEIIDYIYGYECKQNEQEESDAWSVYNAFVSAMSTHTINPCDDIIEDIERDNSEILKYSGSYFIFDESVKVDIQKLRDEYGVLCQSASKPNVKELSKGQKQCSFEKDQMPPKYYWKDILEYVKDIPSNSICILDPYLFKGDNFYPRGHKETRLFPGINNVVKVLELLMPRKLKCKYNVSIYTSSADLGRNGQTKEDIVARLKEELARRLDGDKVEINIIALDDPTKEENKHMEYHDVIHNRRIYTPYLSIRADYGINIIQYDINNSDKDKSLYTQQVTENKLFTIGLDSDSDETIVEEINNFIEKNEKLCTFYKEKEELRDRYQFANSNGDTDLLCHHNRMLDK